MTAFNEDLESVRDMLSKLGVQDPPTIVLSKADYHALALKAKCDPDWWTNAEFFDSHFTWRGLTIRSW